jgi:Holliday junction resolvasome RuvABC endonuclease subunit|tara:strand:+ start:1916 stop:2518 length:603 start_codon:yes stop_codon:yes gene_type:complete
MRVLNRLKDMKILGIDPATHSLAYGLCQMQVNGDIELLDYGKVELVKGQGMGIKIKGVVDALPDIIKTTLPDVAYIEQTVYIQNYQTSRDLSYIVGAAMATAALHKVPIVEASPLVWKTQIGYNRVTKKDILAWSQTMGEKEAKKKASYERKYRVRRLLAERIHQDLLDVDRYDGDEIDAIGIATWGCQKEIEKNLEGIA